MATEEKCDPTNNNGDLDVINQVQNNLLNLDCLEISLAVLDEKIKNFTGAQMVFLDLPKVCNAYTGFVIFILANCTFTSGTVHKC